MCHLGNKKQDNNPILNLMRILPYQKIKDKKPLLNVLNNIFVNFMVHDPIYKKHLKDLDEEKNLKYFSFYNLFYAYETKVKRRV